MGRFMIVEQQTPSFCRLATPQKANPAFLDHFLGKGPRFSMCQFTLGRYLYPIWLQLANIQQAWATMKGYLDVLLE